ncbi:hypothetical protein DFH27DRAFT_549615 [Peziza echinospora]|nr:hypothetical protein DFH27DRAFT_549615 [Peziza echinospora]
MCVCVSALECVCVPFILPPFLFAFPPTTRPSSPPCTSQASFLLFYISVFVFPLFLIRSWRLLARICQKKKLRGTHFTNISISHYLSFLEYP